MARAGEQLRELLRERDLSIRQLASMLAPEGATAKQVENIRGQIHRWLRGKAGGGTDMGAANARRIERVLELEPGYFDTGPPPSPVRSPAEVLLEDVIARLERMEQQQAAVRELQDAVRRLLEQQSGAQGAGSPEAEDPVEPDPVPAAENG